jgi:hypothetical protein
LFVAAGVAVASTGSSLETQADGASCAPRPDAEDTRIASAVNALQVSAPDTQPIAILDTGVSPDTPEIGSRLVDPFDSGSGTDDVADLDGHGTQVAGIAAGQPGRMRGVSPTSPLMPVRVYNRLGTSSTDWLVAGITWAAAHGAAVINISSSTASADASPAEIDALTRAVTNAFDSGSLVVASAGNDGTAQATLPASLPHVLTVGGSDLTGLRATFSNTGAWIDLVAPATSLVAPVPPGYCPSGFAVANGTSFAAPAVAGAAALLAKMRPELSVQQRFDVLRTSARDIDPSGRDDETGFGMLNVDGAVHAAAPPRQSSPEVDDDPFYVRGANAADHPTLLARAKKARVTGQLSPAKDPADVYPVRLKKNERFVASAKVAGTDSLVSLGLWRPNVGDFDVSNGVTKQQIVSTGGFSSDVTLRMRVKTTATYFVSVEVPDAVDPDDPTATVPALEPYTMVLSRATIKTPKTAKGKKKRSAKR